MITKTDRIKLIGLSIFKWLFGFFFMWIPFVAIGRHSIYTISVRYAKFGNRNPEWGYAALCGGGCQEGGFDASCY